MRSDQGLRLGAVGLANGLFGGLPRLMNLTDMLVA
jgi:hypothetical protein